MLLFAPPDNVAGIKIGLSPYEEIRRVNKVKVVDLHPKPHASRAAESRILHFSYFGIFSLLTQIGFFVCDLSSLPCEVPSSSCRSHE